MYSGSTSNSSNFVTWLLLSNARLPRWFGRRTTWTLLLVVSLLLLRNSGTLFHWTVGLLHPLTHLRSVLRHFSLIRHNRTVARASVLWCDINWLIDWLIVSWCRISQSWNLWDRFTPNDCVKESTLSCTRQTVEEANHSRCLWPSIVDL